MNKPADYPRISVIICTLNEEMNLPHVLPRIPTWVDEILLVDGHSTDNTVEVAKKLCPQMRVLSQPGRGKGDALKYGVQNATGEIIVTLDADGQTNPEDIPTFINPLVEGYDFAKGSRLMRGRPPKMPMFRWLGNKILTITSNTLHGTKYTDICSGFNAFWKSAFQRMELVNNGFEMEQEMLVEVKRVGLRVVEVEHFDPGRQGESSKVSGIRQGFVDWRVIVARRFRG